MSERVLTGTWSYPTTVRFGPGRIAELAEACRTAGIARPLFVTDPGLAELEITARALEVLRADGLVDLGEGGESAQVFAAIHANPTGEDVDAGLARFRDAGCDGVVAFGGGAALDAGKAVALMAGQTRPIWDFEDVGDNWRRVDEAGLAPCVAVPTTAGTGSEVGRASVILDVAAHTKKIVFHPRMLPVAVVSDPELTLGLPPHVTAATGLDAFVHCLEAFCAPGFHPMADGIAVEGMRLVARALPRAYADGSDLEARADLLAAASMGATAFQKGLGAVHAISHPVGALYDTHHGLTNAVVLPYVLEFNRPAIESELAHLALVLDLGAPTADRFCEWILELRETLAIPHRLTDLGVPADAAPTIGPLAAVDAAAAGNPIPLDAGALEGIAERALDGDLYFSR